MVTRQCVWWTKTLQKYKAQCVLALTACGKVHEVWPLQNRTPGNECQITVCKMITKPYFMQIHRQWPFTQKYVTEYSSFSNLLYLHLQMIVFARTVWQPCIVVCFTDATHSELTHTASSTTYCISVHGVDQLSVKHQHSHNGTAEAQVSPPGGHYLRLTKHRREIDVNKHIWHWILQQTRKLCYSKDDRAMRAI